MLPGSVGELHPGSFDVKHPIPDPEVRRIFEDRENYLREYQARVRPLLETERARWEGDRIDLLAELKPWFEPLMAMADHVWSAGGTAPRSAGTSSGSTGGSSRRSSATARSTG